MRGTSGTAGTAQVIYSKRFDVLESETDELPLAMRSYPKSFVDYSLGQAYYLDFKETLGDRYMQSAMADLAKFKSEITPRGRTGPINIKVVDVVDGEDGLGFF